MYQKILGLLFDWLINGVFGQLYCTLAVGITKIMATVTVIENDEVVWRCFHALSQKKEGSEIRRKDHCDNDILRLSSFLLLNNPL